jgi:hypothetical protein
VQESPNPQRITRNSKVKVSSPPEKEDTIPLMLWIALKPGQKPI